jgi:two-component system chemotaxis response regulator CheY
MAHIMAVDDSFSLRQLLVRTLVEGGHRVVEAKDGLEALGVAATHKLQLVITDVNMPQMDGLTLVKKLRELPAYKYVPILVLTTEMDPTKKKVAKDAGATGWIVKPFEPVQLLATIRKVLD